MRPWTDATGTARPTSAEMLHEQAESDARMAKRGYFYRKPVAVEPGPPCDPPYHRPDCYGTNCDDPETRERCDPF